MTQTVPKELVHKWGLAEVFVTGFARTSDEVMVLTAELPKSHQLYNESPVRQTHIDFAAVIEACRQACFVVAHKLLEVPMGLQFLLKNMESKLMTDRRFDRSLEMTARIRDLKRRGNVLAGVTWDFEVRDVSGPVARLNFTQIWVERLHWRELRSKMRSSRGLSTAIPTQSGLRSRFPPTHPYNVGRSVIDNVVITDVVGFDGHWRTFGSVPITHPVLFDHPMDHVYAMVQLEMGRQFSSSIIASVEGISPHLAILVANRSAFLSTAELDMPLAITSTDYVNLASGEILIDSVFSQASRSVSNFSQRYRLLEGSRTSETS